MMELPTILQGALAPIDEPPISTRSTISGAADHKEAALEFVMQRQEQTNWCWSAVSVSVSKYFDSSSVWTQCELVCVEFGNSDCCGDGNSTACNQPWYLDRALRRTGNLDTWRPGTIAPTELMQLLREGRPVAARIGWPGGGGHVVALTACMRHEGNSFVVVGDPWHGSQTYAYKELCARYKGTGVWTHTYFTKSE